MQKMCGSPHIRLYLNRNKVLKQDTLFVLYTKIHVSSVSSLKQHNGGTVVRMGVRTANKIKAAPFTRLSLFFFTPLKVTVGVLARSADAPNQPLIHLLIPEFTVFGGENV